MVYDLLEILFGNFLIEQEKKMPKCKTCKKRMEAQGRPWLFLLPVYSDERYHASADYFKKNCIPIRLPYLAGSLSSVRFAENAGS